MAKTIKITLYTPKELWVKFCNKVFWPRRKQCTDWCDYYDGVLTSKVFDILSESNSKGEISDETAENLELAIKQASAEVAKLTAELMSKPYE